MSCFIHQFSRALHLLRGGLKSLRWGSLYCEGSTLWIIASGLYNITGGSKEKNGTPNEWRQANEAVSNKEMGSCKASRDVDVLQPTLERYVKDRQKSSSETVKTKLGRKQVLPCEAMSTVFWWKESFLASQWQTSCVSLTNLL